MAKTAVVSKAPTQAQYTRETVESIIVAFILAFLFRAFVAEAFVIPTGSMAPTLMGAHKDLVCQECGVPYQVGASYEFNQADGSYNGSAVVGSTAAISEALNPIDFNDPNQATFNGDRILVSKFDYVFSSPQRWDVLVFKFPGEARMNYIKRLIGLPNEQLMIQEGDVYVRKNDNEKWQIARKPPHKALAMRQPVTDTNYLSKSLTELGYPSLWQPVSSSGGNGTAEGWKVEQSAASWHAELASTSDPQWLRYFHKSLTEREWLAVLQDKQLPESKALNSTLVTDYLAYNSYMLYHQREQMTPDELVSKIRPSENGLHWVGDLTAEYDVEVQSDSGSLMLQLFEFGIEFRLSIDVATGEAKLQAFDATTKERKLLDGIFAGDDDVVAATKVRGKGKYHVAMGNVDEQIFVWINGSLVRFNQPAEFDSWEVRDAAQRRPYWSKEDPMDAAPLGIGGKSLAMKVTRAQVYRDLYYIALRSNGSHEYGPNINAVRATAPVNSELSRMGDTQLIRYLYGAPELWETTSLFANRQKQLFQLDDKQYFPMGDNSAQSSDARMWDENYVEERFLLGKALLVFWPHSWNRPFPFFPNVRRMGLIR
jgi:signal peptidase I